MSNLKLALQYQLNTSQTHVLASPLEITLNSESWKKQWIHRLTKQKAVQKKPQKTNPLKFTAIWKASQSHS